jgi:AmmeMemoRadiSam system protein B
MTQSYKPRLRALDFQPVIYQEQQMWLLRDPLELSDHQLILSPALAQMLVFCDGTRGIEEVQSAFLLQFGFTIEQSAMLETLAQLDEAYLLVNERSRQAIEALRQTYRDLPHRFPALAGVSYPEDPADLREALDAFGQGDDLDGWLPWTGRAVVSPHIDYFRGGRVYSHLWRRARAAVERAELVLIFGTDHNGSPGSITLTQKPYATPYGIIPTDLGLVDALSEAVGPKVFDQELNHLNEHSIELSAVWFHHIRGQDPCPMLPILCGSFQEYVMNGHHPADDRALTAFVETLRAATSGRRVLAVASVDLAHVGPSFGDDFVMDEARRSEIRVSDGSLLEAIGRGDDERFYREVAAIEDRNRICGFSSIYLMLRFLELTRGTQIAYEHCPADSENHSLVSICGMLLD